MTPEYLTIRHAAQRASVSKRTIYNWLAQGRLVAVRTPGGAIRIDASSLFRPAGPREHAVPGLRRRAAARP